MGLCVACWHSHHSHPHLHLLLNIDRVLLLAIRCDLLEFVSDGCLKHLCAAHLLALVDRWQVLLLLRHAVQLMILLVHAHGLHLG